ncbi:MAG: hypothetical protein PHD01_12760 [Geobacteraceae bacterium]|nr:hypothetical protein [Geobacteraceae bacterium]
MKEVDNSHHHPDQEETAKNEGNAHPELHVRLCGHVANTQHLFQIGLQHSGGPEGEPHEHHGAAHGPEPNLASRGWYTSIPFSFGMA